MLFRVVALMVGHAVRCFRGDREHGRIHRAVAVLDVVRSERAVELVHLRRSSLYLPGCPSVLFVEIGRPSTADVKHDQTDGPSDGRVGDGFPDPKAFGPPFMPTSAAKRSVDDDERRGDVGGRLHYR